MLSELGNIVNQIRQCFVPNLPPGIFVGHNLFIAMTAVEAACLFLPAPPVLVSRWLSQQIPANLVT